MVTADGDESNDMEETEDDQIFQNIRQQITFNSDPNDSVVRIISGISDSSDDDLITSAKQMNLLECRPSNAASH